ncbi:hypothetical protein [Xanthomonas tesorieronis]|uniref:hypothetical protein n=1 Tax=Xanthomonas tesorieronis TaxID=3160839 RepID=UPI0035115FCD
MHVEQFMDFSLLAGSIGLAARLGILVLGFLLLWRCAPGRPRSLLQWGLVLLLAHVLLPRLLGGMVGVWQLASPSPGIVLWVQPAIRLLQDLLFAIGLALLLQALWLSLPRKRGMAQD